MLLKLWAINSQDSTSEDLPPRYYRLRYEIHKDLHSKIYNRVFAKTLMQKMLHSKIYMENREMKLSHSTY